MILKKLDSKKLTLVFDCETNGLYDEVTKIWCIVAEEYFTGQMYLFHDFEEFCGKSGLDEEGVEFTIPVKDGSLEEGVKFLHRAKSLICHNQISFDQPVLHKFFPKFKLRHNWPEIRDTLLESQVGWYDRSAVKGYKGLHNLAVWGARLGIRKPDITDWSFMDILKLNRCIADVRINTLVAKELEQEREMFMTMMGRDCTESLITEHEYAFYCAKQERNGALVDADHMRECIVDLNEKITRLKSIIEPQLPPTITFKGGKETIHDVAKALGVVQEKLPPIQYEWKEFKGEQKKYAIKKWHKPCVKWWTVEKGKQYGITINGDEVISIEDGFGKLKSARDYFKDNFLDSTLLGKHKQKATFPNKETEKRLYDSHTINHFGEQLTNGTSEIIGAFTKVNIKPSQMSQHEKVKLLLVGLGWNTDEWTFLKDSDGKDIRSANSGCTVWPEYTVEGHQLTVTYKRGERIPVNPKISEDSYATLPDGLGQQISEHNAYTHRRNFIENPTKDDKGLLNNIRSDGRITCGIMTFGTTAGRASQFNWVNAPGLKALYGKEIRQIIIASPDSTLIGVDMPNAHPRLLADFTGNATLIAAVDGLETDLETGDFIGKDFHTVNSVLFRLNTEGELEEARKTQCSVLIAKILKMRGKGKGGSFCTLYGGSAKKLAMTIGIEEGLGKEIMQNFLSGLGLDKLLAEIKDTWEDYKYKRGSFIHVLGGYMIYCNSEHKIINYKALGSEAVVQKMAVILIGRKMEKLNLKARLIVNYHDELLFDVPNNELDTMKGLCNNLYPDAAKELGLTLDWSSYAMLGQDYSACH